MSEKEAAPNLAAAVRHHGQFQFFLNLTLARYTAQLKNRLMQVAHAMHSSFGKLAAIRIQWKVAIKRDATATIDEITGFACPAKAESLKPTQHEPAETIVDVRRSDIFGS